MTTPHTVKDICPNCDNPDPRISPMPDGNCGVCGGTGTIEWEEVCKLSPTPQSVEEIVATYSDRAAKMFLSSTIPGAQWWLERMAEALTAYGTSRYEEGVKAERERIWKALCELAEPDERQFGAEELHTHLDEVHNIINHSTDKYKCQSHYDDNDVLQDCTCGKCE